VGASKSKEDRDLPATAHTRQPKTSLNRGFGFTTRRVRLEARRHREDNVSRIFRNRSTASIKSAKPLLEEDVEGEEKDGMVKFPGA